MGTQKSKIFGSTKSKTAPSHRSRGKDFVGKRGMSTVIFSIILIFSVLIAIVVIGLVIKTIVSGGIDQFFVGKSKADLKIKSVVIKDNSVGIHVKRNPGRGELTGIRFVISDGVETEIFQENTTLEELKEQTFNLDYDGLLKEISIAPILRLDSGEIFISKVSDKFEFSDEEIVKNITGLVSWWGFEEDAKDEIGNNNGVINKAVFVEGKFWKAVEFSGSESYIDIIKSSGLNIKNSMTIEMWYKKNSLSTSKAENIIGDWYWDFYAQSRRGWVLRNNLNSNSVSFIIELTNGETISERQVTAPSLVVGKWYHVVVVFNPLDRTSKIYVDGILKNTDTASQDYTQISTSDSNIKIGSFNGLLDEVKIYNCALSDDKIKSLYQLDFN